MGDAGRPYSGSQWLGPGWVAILGGGARGGGLELEFQLEFDSVEVVEFGLGGLGCPLKAVKFALLQDKCSRSLCSSP